MRLGIFIITLFLATFIGITIYQDPGYALFAYREWTLETPLWVAAVLLLVLIAIILCLLWTINTLFNSRRRMKNWWATRKQKRASKDTTRGLLELAEGYWLKAEQSLKNSAHFSESPIINYLAAAKAAASAGAEERRDHYLALAHDSNAGAETAIQLIEAKLLLQHGDFAPSLDLLQRLHRQQPKHPEVLRLMAACHEAQQNWQALYLLLPALRKGKILPVPALEVLEQKVLHALLPLKAQEGKTALLQFWRNTPTVLQQAPGIYADYIEALIAAGAETEAEALLKSSLKKTWDPKLAYLYGKVQSPSAQKQLNFAESLLPGHEQDPVLLLTLGHLCFREQLWGKAKDYLEASLALEASAETYLLLGQLMDRLGFPAKRDEYYKEGLVFATHKKFVNASNA